MKKMFMLLVILFVLFVIYQMLNENNTSSNSINNSTLSSSLVKQDIPIIDIRTKKEWQKTGVVSKSFLITFYNEDGSFNDIKFIEDLSKIVSKNDSFAILCRSGNRSNRVARFLKSKGFSNVINLSGGIKLGIKNNIKLEKRILVN